MSQDGRVGEEICFSLGWWKMGEGEMEDGVLGVMKGGIIRHPNESGL